PRLEHLTAFVAAHAHQRPDPWVLRDRPERLLVPPLERLEPDATPLQRYVKCQPSPSANERRMRRATTPLCTSPGPSYIRRLRASPHMSARGVPSVRPSPPCTCNARSSTSPSTRAAKNLISEISTRASSPSSSRCAAWSVMSRHAWMSAADSAIQFWIVC